MSANLMKFSLNRGKKLISKLSEEVITSILNLSIFWEDATIELADIVRTYFLMNMEQSTNFEKNPIVPLSRFSCKKYLKSSY